MKTLVVIVNYRTPKLVRDCLDSLAGEVAANDVHVIVTDNASGDGSAEELAEVTEPLDWCTFMPLPKNGGFAYGNNEAIRAGLDGKFGDVPEYVWLLNPDTLVRSGAIAELVKFMDAHPDVGIAGGRTLDREGEVYPSAFRLPTVAGEVESVLRFGPATKLLWGRRTTLPIPDEPTPVGWVAGASMMVRREVFEDAGLMDEGYFMYFEETDFCLRAKEAGWPTWHVPASVITHLIGQSSGTTGADAVKKRRPRFWFDSRRRYMRRNLGFARSAAANGLFLVTTPTSRFLQKVRGGPRLDPPHLWRDFVRYTLLP
jgi:GT2 family glycosyltransferase